MAGSKTSRISSNTPLEHLCDALCNPSGDNLFRYQNDLYMMITVFPSNEPDQADNGSYMRQVDDMIPDIRDYIASTIKTGTSNPDDAPIHALIYSNLRHCQAPASRPYELKSGETGIRSSNVRKYISGKKPLPLSLRNVLEKCRDNKCYEPVIRRLFWILQYYLVYYLHRANSFCITPCEHVPSPSAYPEYYKLTPRFAEKILDRLSLNCKSYSKTLQQLKDPFRLEIMDLTHILVDILIRHHNGQESDSLEPLQSLHLLSATKNDEQMRIYQTCIDCYSKNSYDRFNVLCKWADQNCYAAAELGDIYAHGRELHIGIIGGHRIPVDRAKALKLYEKAMSLSNPPYPYACWSYADLLRTKYNFSLKKDNSILQKACTILNNTGNYPPALNLLGDIETMLADQERGEYTNPIPEELLEKYKQALHHIINSAENGWYYANSRLSIFCANHAKDAVLINALISDPSIAPYMDRESQLKVAVENKSLWVANALAQLYISQGRKKEAKELLKIACDMNYNVALYTMAVDIFPNTIESAEYLQRSSALGYPHASCRLAEMYYESSNTEKALSYINLARDQMNAWLEKDMDMTMKIEQLKTQIEHDFRLSDMF